MGLVRPGLAAPAQAGTAPLALRPSPVVPTRAARRPRRGWLDVPALAGAIVAVSLVIRVVWPGFTWFGDNTESFFPMWHVIGSALRAGQWLGIDPSAFAGGNIAGEAAYGMFNPVTLANAALVSTFDDLAQASFLVMVEFLVLLGLGVRALSLAYGAGRPAAFTAGAILPFGGFTLYYGAGNWASGLMAVTWTVWTWWAARRYATGARGPLPLVVAGALALTVGNPFSALGVVVVLLGTAVELAVGRRPRRLAGLVVAGLCVGACALLTYLPLLGALPTTFRTAEGAVSNHGYAAPSLGDLAGLSSPTLLPEFDVWRATSDKVASVYLSWLVLPLLPWLRWRAAGPWRSRLGLLVPTVLFLLLTLGPDRIWLFRWPLRLVEYSWAGIAVCFAVVLSAGLARDHVPRRSLLTAALVGWGFFLAWSSRPQQLVGHLVMSAVVAALVALTVWTVRRHGLRALPVLAVAGTLAVTPAQVGLHNWGNSSVVRDLDIGRPSDLAAVRSATAVYRGTVLQISSPFSVAHADAVRSGQLSYGNMLAAAGHPVVNRYTGIGYPAFLSALGMDYRGAINDGNVLTTLFSTPPGFDGTVADALGVDTLVLDRALQYPPDALDHPGWHIVLRDPDRIVLRRDTLLPAGVSVTAGPGVRVLSTREAGTDVRLTLDAPAGGRVLLGRLAWPGSTAAADGVPIPVRTGPLGLVELSVPPGTRQITVEYEIPGLRPGLLLVLIAGAVALAHQSAWWLTAHRRRRRRQVPSRRPPRPSDPLPAPRPTGL